MKVYASPDDTALGRKIRNALEAIAVDKDSGVAALVAPGSFAVRYVILVYSYRLQGVASVSAMSQDSDRAHRVLRRAGLKVETRDGVVLTVKHDRCHSQINREPK